jgi:hypothetical protein
MQTRYQYGSLQRRRRAKGPDVWQWRWYENGSRKSVLIGTVEKLVTQKDALLALEDHRMRVNAEMPLATSFGPFRRFNLAHLGTL